jgi:hypothetical protein
VIDVRDDREIADVFAFHEKQGSGNRDQGVLTITSPAVSGTVRLMKKFAGTLSLPSAPQEPPRP